MSTAVHLSSLILLSHAHFEPVRLFIKNPTPKTVEDYREFIDKEIDFVERRNRRIKEYIANVQ